MPRSIAVPFLVLFVFLLAAVFFNPLSGSRLQRTNAALVKERQARRDAEEEAMSAQVETHATAAGDLAAADGAQVSAGPPVAVAEEKLFEFGSMDPYSKSQHIFKVRNEGQSMLILRPGPNSCRCTLNEIIDKYVAPGDSGRVLVEWNSAARAAEFAQSATVRTNDPANPTIKFRISGETIVKLGVHPPELSFPNLAPGQEGEIEALIFSQKFDDLQVGNFTSSLAGVEFETLDAPAELLSQHDAQSGYRLRVRVPGDLPSGDFTAWVRYQADQPEVLTGQINLRGKVLRRLSVYGEGVDATGKISFGAIESGAGANRKLLLKVRDPDPEIRVREIVAEPEWLRAKVVPFGGEANSAALYRLEIEIPEDAPAGIYAGAACGALKLSFDHPRLADLQLRVEVIVETAEGK